MPQIWALLVCIQRYAAHDNWEEALGATQDAENVRDYLLRDLGVPPRNVRVLLNKEATRERILSTFVGHLIENREIQHGDALMFYFSGHGSRCRAPRDWPIVEDYVDDMDGEERHLLEVLVPYDESTPVKGSPGRLVCGITDRTLGALLSKAARAHGENITVVLDCCHSGHGTRKNDELLDELGELFTARGVPADSLAPLWDDVDHELWTEDASVGIPHLRGAFTERQSKSHVLLAACGQRESALGGRKGGLFTACWLRALRDKELFPRSYSEILRHVNRSFDRMRARNPDIAQHPQCEGITRDRIVFHSEEQHQNRFPVQTSIGQGGRTDLGDYRIEAGAIHGVRPNTMFEVYDAQHAPREGAFLGTLFAKEVDAASCIAYAVNGTQPNSRRMYARISQLAYSLVYAIANVAPDARASHVVVDKLRRRIDGAPADSRRVWHEVHTRDKPDLIFEVDGAGITLRRCDHWLRHLSTTSPRIEAEDIEQYFPVLLHVVARFNFFLRQSNPTHPFAEDVRFEFHLLEADSEYDFLDDNGDLEFIRIRKLRRQIAFKNSEAVIRESPSDGYAFVLRNMSSAPLYPHLVYFDPSTYAIETWYSPFEPDRPTLLPFGHLQIGASAEHQGDFAFFLRPGEHSDTSFVKLLILDTPAQLSFMEQRPFLGRGEQGMKYIQHRAAGDDDGPNAPSLKGRWDCLTRKVTVQGHRGAK